MMIDLFNNFIYYQDFKHIDIYTMIRIFDDTLLFDLLPDYDASIEIFINHHNKTINMVKLFINNMETSILLNNYETITIILRTNIFLKNTKLKNN